MSGLGTVVATAVLLGAALMAGVFFAFSSFVMKALARAPGTEGITVMQSINVVVLNPSFLLAFLGTAMLSVVLAVLAARSWGAPEAAFFLAGATCYLAGTFLVTVAGNVPLNDQLAAVDVNDGDARAVWANYLERWTRWNYVRTAAATTAVLLCASGLAQTGGGATAFAARSTFVGCGGAVCETGETGKASSSNPPSSPAGETRLGLRAFLTGVRDERGRVHPV